MDDSVSLSALVESLMPERLQRLHRVSGAPVVFGGTTRRTAALPHLVISRLIGTVGSSLAGLAVHAGRGLGGAVLRDGTPHRADDYAATATITHDYDRMVVEEERLTSVFAVPVVVHAEVHGILYAAVRDGRPVGDRAVTGAMAVAVQLRRDVERQLAAPLTDAPPRTRASAALGELADVIARTTDPELRARLTRVHRSLAAEHDLPRRRDTALPAPELTPREVDALRLVAVGASNVEIGAELGLSPETVKAYLRAAMRKLDVHNRTAAVHAARAAGAL